MKWPTEWAWKGRLGGRQSGRQSGEFKHAAIYGESSSIGPHRSLWTWVRGLLVDDGMVRERTHGLIVRDPMGESRGL